MGGLLARADVVIGMRSVLAHESSIHRLIVKSVRGVGGKNVGAP